MFSKAWRNFQVLNVVAVMLMAGAANAGPVLIGIRGNAAATERYCRLTSCSLMNDKTIEFDNGNTFVRINGIITNKEVQILVPDRLDANQLMEVLLKVKAAKSSGARTVTVVTSIPADEITITRGAGKGEFKNSTFQHLISVAGAQFLQERNLQPVRLKRYEPKFNMMKPKDSVILNISHESFAEQLGYELGFPVTNKVNPAEMSGKQVFVVAPAIVPVNETFIETFETVEKINNMGGEVIWVTPNLPYARSDKNDQPDGVTSALGGRLIADIIEAAGSAGVSFVRAHAPQSEGFFSIPVYNISGRKTVAPFLAAQNVEQVISPDAGFQKDATLYADDLKVPVGVINKSRDPVTAIAKLVGISGDPVKGKTVVITDDETATGGTLAKAAKLLKELGAKRVICLVTHLTGPATQALESEYIDLLVVTDTLPINTPKNSKLVVLSMAAEVGAKLANINANTFGLCRQMAVRGVAK